MKQHKVAIDEIAETKEESRIGIAEIRNKINSLNISV